MEFVELIIFDLDGTLIDSRQDITNSVNYTLTKLGLRRKRIEEISSYIGTGVEDLIRRSLGSKDDVLFNEAISLFKDYYRKHFTDNSILYPGAKEVLEYFKHKKKIIITNRNYEFAVMGLEHLGINMFFDDVIGGDDRDCRKPSSCSLDRTIHRLDICKERTIIVGDMDIDVITGRNAGINTCAVTYGIGKKRDIIKAKPDFIINSLIELKNIIE